MLMKYFLAEGLTKGNIILVASRNESPWDIVNKLFVTIIPEVITFFPDKCFTITCSRNKSNYAHTQQGRAQDSLEI